MNNKNIRVIFFEAGLFSEELIKKFEKCGAKVCSVLKDELVSAIKKEKMPLFHCCVIGSDDFISAAADEGIRCVCADKKIASEIDMEYFLVCGRIKPYEVDTEGFVEGDMDLTDTGHLESIFALGNGYLGLRGTYDEQDDKVNKISGMYINEIFEKESMVHLFPCKGFARNEQFTVNLCDWRILEVYVDGEKACYSGGLKNHRRCLDFMKGEITRGFEFESKSGKKVRVESVRMASNSRVHSAIISFSVTALTDCKAVEIRSSVIKNTLTNGKITTQIVSEKVEGEKLYIETRTNTTKLCTAAAIGHKVKCEKAFSTAVKNGGNYYTYIISTDLSENDSLTVEKYASFYSDADQCGNILEKSQEELKKNISDGFEAIREEQTAYWKKHWETGDVVIEGNEADQQAIRLSLFHLKSQLPSINNASIGATGLTGANYSGISY